MFPISASKEAILYIISTSNVSVIKSNTGSGKTLYIPPLLVNEYAPAKVRVAIPLIVGVSNAYSFVKEHNPKISIGFAAQRERHYKTEDQLVYATTNHFNSRVSFIFQEFKNSLRRAEAVREVTGDYFIIDEVHMLSEGTSFLMGLIKEAFVSHPELQPKIIFMSATTDMSEIKRIYQEVPLFSLETCKYPVEVNYLDKLDLKIDYEKEIIKIIQVEKDRMEREGVLYHGIVFRPGVNEVMTLYYTLSEIFPTFDIFPAHSNLSKEEMKEIFQDTEKVKIIIGTNVIESSVTIAKVGFIIDDCRIKINTSNNLGGSCLKEVNTVQSESIQRQGRTGRTMPGRAYRLITREVWESLPEFRAREVDRIPIHKPILTLLNINVSPMRVLGIDESKVLEAMAIFSKLGLINPKSSDPRRIVTDIGIFTASSSLTIENSLMLYYALKEVDSDCIEFFQCLLVVISFIEACDRGYFFYRYRRYEENLESYKNYLFEQFTKFHSRFIGETDLHTFNNLYWEMIEAANPSYSLVSNVKNFCNDNSLNNRKFNEALIVLKNLHRSYDIPNITYKDWGRTYDAKELIEEVTEFFHRAYRYNLYVVENLEIYSSQGLKCLVKNKAAIVNVDYLYAANISEIEVKPNVSRHYLNIIAKYPPIKNLGDLMKAAEFNPMFLHEKKVRMIEKMTTPELTQNIIEFNLNKEDFEGYFIYCLDREGIET